MKTCLVFLKTGEIIERKIKNRVFLLTDFEYTCYKQYDNIILLYTIIIDRLFINAVFQYRIISRLLV